MNANRPVLLDDVASTFSFLAFLSIDSVDSRHRASVVIETCITVAFDISGEETMCTT